MKTVSRLTYTFWSLFYQSLCLSGLIWQVTQISINFFQFDVNKDINIRMPNEIDLMAGKSLYLCFEMEQFIDEEQFRVLNKTAMSTRQRHAVDRWQREGMSWSIARSYLGGATVGEIFQVVLNESIIGQSNIIQFLFDDQICFTSSNTRLGSINFGDKYTKRRNRVLDYVTSISVALGNNYPYFEPQSLIEIDSIHKIRLLYLRSYSYNIIKKEFPYSDKCYDYRLSKIVNQYEARRKCYESTLLSPFGNKKVANSRIISKNDFHFYDSTRTIFNMGLMGSFDWNLTGGEQNCEQTPPECNRTVHFTSSRIYGMWIRNVDLDVRIVPGYRKDLKEPSFTLVSKPRIDNIDYVTYILGALGSWLGFSFVGINPVPYLLTVANVALSNQVDDLSNQSNTENSNCNSNYIIILSNRVARNETKCNELKQELKIDFESKIEQQNNVIRSMNSTIRKLITEINSLKPKIIQASVSIPIVENN